MGQEAFEGMERGMSMSCSKAARRTIWRNLHSPSDSQSAFSIACRTPVRQISHQCRDISCAAPKRHLGESQLFDISKTLVNRTSITANSAAVSPMAP